MIDAAYASWALLSRDLRAVSRSRSQLYSSLLFPLMLLALLGTGVSSGLAPTSPRILNGDYTSYLAPGMIAMTALFSSTFSSAGFYRDRESGLLRAMLASPHSAQTILFGKALGAILIGTVQALAVLVLAVVIPGIDLAWQFGWLGGVSTVVITVLALNFMLSGISLLLAVRIKTMQGFHLIMNLVLFPLFFLSGAFFPLDQVPTWLEVIGYINPLTYAVDLLHYASYADSPDGLIGPLIDGLVLGGLATLLFVFGLRRAPRAV
ncbi:MAG: ABC transporter permease [Chloroflexota bacterium]|nr:ABC transporter permease [Chloroflexota bacterium]